MKMLSRAAVGLSAAFGCLSASVALAQSVTSVAIKDGNGASQSLGGVSCRTNVICYEMAPIDTTGTQIDPATKQGVAAVVTALGSPFQAGGSIGNTAFGISGSLPAGSNVVGGVTQSGTWNIGAITSLPALPTGANAIGTVGVTALPALPTGANTIGTVNLGTLNGAATAANQATGNGTLSSILTALGSPAQAGGSVGISGTLPAFAATPTFNLGTLNGAATATLQSSMITALGSPFQAGGSIGNTSFGAKLLDSTGVAFGTSGNPVYVTGPGGGSGLGGVATAANPSYSNNATVSNFSFDTSGNLRVTGAGGGSMPTGSAGSPNAAVVSIQGVSGGTVVPVSGTFYQATQPVSLASLPALAAGSNAIGSITNSSFGATQSGAWNITNISGTVSLPTGAAIAAKQPALGTAGAPSADVITVQGASSMTPLKTDGSAVTQPVSISALPALAAGSATIGSIANTAFGITGTLPAFAATPTVNLGTLNGAATAAKQPALGTAGTPSPDVLTVQGAASMTALKVDGSAVTQPVSAAALPLPTGAATATNQTTANTSLGTIATNTAPPGIGALAAVPSGSTNGTALGTLPTGGTGARFYLGSSDSVTFTVATSAPGSAPANTFTISGAASGGTGPNWDESLAGGAMIYITATSGSPKFRWF